MIKEKGICFVYKMVPDLPSVLICFVLVNELCNYMLLILTAKPGIPFIHKLNLPHFRPPTNSIFIENFRSQPKPFLNEEKLIRHRHYNFSYLNCLPGLSHVVLSLSYRLSAISFTTNISLNIFSTQTNCYDGDEKGGIHSHFYLNTV